MLSDNALLGTRIAAAFSLFIVANLVYALVKARNQAAGARSWARTTGRIVSSTVSRPALVGKGDETRATVEVRYQYHVGDKDYEGDRIRFGGRSGTSAVIADRIAAKYPPGAVVDVYYNPKSPSRAVLEPGDKGNVTALIAFLIVFVAISAVLVAHSVAGKVLSTSDGTPLFAYLLPLFAMLVGLGSLVEYGRMRRRQSASQRWPSAPGTITQAGVIAEEREEADDERSDGLAQVTMRYRADVRFSYTVNGRVFHADRWKWGLTAYYPDEAAAAAVIARYRAGAPVRVFYNPANPGEAVLEPGNSGGSFAQLVFAVMFAGAGALMWWAFSMGVLRSG